MEQTEGSARERILARIRTAMRTTAPGHPGETVRPIFAPVTESLERFQKECAGNNTECIVIPDLSATAVAVADVLASLPPGEIFVQDAPKLRGMATDWQKGRTVRWSSEGGPRETCQATITLAEALVALTGSVLVSAACGGRGASVVAPVHIVVASAGQLVPDLERALEQVRERGAQFQNSFLCLITGSSRTADIEKILVMGAHGPRRLIVVLPIKTE